MYVIAVLKLCLEYFLIEFIEKKILYVYDLSIDKKKKCFKGNFFAY